MLRRHGRSATCFQTLESNLHHWFCGEACVAYADTGTSWVVAGDPICVEQRRSEVIRRFVDAAREARRRVRFFALEDAEAAADSQLSTICIGHCPVWDPRGWSEVLREKRSLREQLRRARAKRVRVRRVPTDEITDETSPTRARIEDLAAHWVDSRRMAPMGFMVQIEPFSFASERRFFVAERDRRLVGVMIAVPIYARSGWFLEDTLREPDAPNGTIELLFDLAMRDLGDSGSHHVTFGLTPLAGITSPWLRRIRDATRWLYDFDGLRAFRTKLKPHSWQPVFLAYPRRERGIGAVVDALRAFAGGSLLRFGWRTLIHRAPTVTLVLALLLIPWAALLALPAAAVWFPSRAIQYGWVGLDVALVGAMLTLAARWRPRLARLLGGAAAADFVGGALQALTHTVQRATTPLGWLAIAPALAAPLFASVFFFSAARHRRHRRSRQPQSLHAR